MMKQQSTEFRTALEAAVLSFGLDPFTEHQTAQLAKHYALLCRWNERINLTRVTDAQEAARLHYAESLFGASFIEKDSSVLDIGSGAGFPAVPIAVVRPDLLVIALEANNKKSLFLKEAKDELGLENLSVVTARLEGFDWSGYELLTSRALEKAESIFPSVIEQMSQSQRLMLYCAGELLEAFERKLRGKVEVESHAIPLSRERIVAIFSRERTTNDADSTDWR